MESYPLTCVWEVTMGCNMRCKHCGSACEFPLPGELTTEEAYKFIDMCSDIGMQWVNLSGGEPFTRKDLLLLVKRFKSKNIPVNIISNGWLITEEIAEELKNIGDVAVAISLDGVGALHDEIRKPGAFAHAKKSFELLIEKGIYTDCITTITKKNIDHLDEIKDFLNSQGVEIWQVQMGLPMGNMAKHCDWVIEPSDIEKIIDYCYKVSGENKVKIVPADCIGYYNDKETEVYKRFYELSDIGEWEGCHAGLRSFGLLHNGDVIGCTSIRNPEFVEGNIKERSLREIWEDPKSFAWRRGFKKENLKGDCLKCKHAEQCLGGCPNTRLSLNGDICSENIYCTYNLLLKNNLVNS